MGFFSRLLDNVSTGANPLDAFEESLDPGAAVAASTEPFTGVREAAAKVAAAQERAAAEAIAFQEETEARIRADLEPFATAGAGTLPSLSALIQDPQAQREFIEKDPFFKILSDEAQKNLINRQAARGKVGSGETAELLQNKLLLLGQSLVGRNVGQQFNLASLGATAAAGQATGSLQTGGTIADLLTQLGNVRGAGIVGEANREAELLGGAAQVFGGFMGGSSSTGAAVAGSQTGGAGTAVGKPTQPGQTTTVFPVTKNPERQIRV